MSGPVANGLAQLDDALLEIGLDRSFIFDVLHDQFLSIDLHLVRLEVSRGPHVERQRTEMKARKQRIFDALAVLWPTWRETTIGADHEIALREASSHAARWPFVFPAWTEEARQAEQYEEIVRGGVRAGVRVASRQESDARGMGAVVQEAYDEAWCRMENARSPGRYVLVGGRIHDTARRGGGR